jgi:hypothetical protein
MADDKEPEDEFEGGGDEDEMDFGEDGDLGELLTSLLTTEDGDNVATALVNLNATLAKHLETQNKILVKILSKLPSA